MCSWTRVLWPNKRKISIQDQPYRFKPTYDALGDGIPIERHVDCALITSIL